MIVSDDQWRSVTSTWFNAFWIQLWKQIFGYSISKHHNFIGGEGLKVSELRGVVCFELEAYPEPKVLTSEYLRQVRLTSASIQEVAVKTGLSWSAVQERLSLIGSKLNWGWWNRPSSSPNGGSLKKLLRCSMLGRIFLFFIFVLFTGCSGLRERPGANCSDYEPSCEFLGATKECSYNSNGCKSCTCVPNPGTKLYEQQQRNPWCLGDHCVAVCYIFLSQFFLLSLALNLADSVTPVCRLTSANW